MSTFNVHGGHNFKVPGASGCFSETTEDRNVKNKVIALLRAEGHTVYDCTDEDGTTQSKNLANIVALQNRHAVDLDISIHFNASNGQGHGTEVLQYSSKTQNYSKRIVDNIAALGFRNRGVKDGSKLYVLRKSKSRAILIECCFCDNAEDAKIYNADKMASAIVSGILNKNVQISDSSKPAQSNTSSEQMYRVRKSWGDVKSQIGAYRNLDNAKAECPAGYTVYDKNGNAVYCPSSTINNTNSQMYRIRKSWNDAKSQIGAYRSLDNAKAECKEGYTVYDSNGNAVYSIPKKVQPVAEQMYRVRKSWGDAKSQIGAYKNLDNAKAECPAGYTVYDKNGNAVYCPSSTINNTNSQMYRIRKSWGDAKSQIGAYRNLDNAKAECPNGYTVYDKDGNAVYTKSVASQPTTTDQMYRVRKSWSDAKSQIGAYRNLDNAKAECKEGYTVYDKDGNAVYFNIKDNNSNTSATTETKPSNTPAKVPEAVDVNGLKDMSQDAFIQYIGNLAKADKNGILPSITIAQAILESGWGSSELCRKANNLFGMKKSLSGNNWGSEWDGKIYTVKTKEEEDGKIIEILADFRSYNSVAESVKDHNKYLANAKNGNKLRYNGMINCKDYKTAAKLLLSGGYATDSKYPDKLCNIIERYSLDAFDYAGDTTEIENENKELKSALSVILGLLEKIIEIIKNVLKK